MLGFIGILGFGYLASRYLKTHDRKWRRDTSKKIKKHAVVKSYAFVRRIFAEKQVQAKSTSAVSTKHVAPKYAENQDGIHHNDPDLYDTVGPDEDDVFEDSAISGLDVVEPPIFLLPLSPWGGTQTPEEYP